MFVSFHLDTFRHIAYHPEAYTLDIRIPPDALRVLRVCLQPCIMLGMSPGGTAQVCGIIHIETAPDHMLCSGLRTFRIHGPVLQHGIGILGIPVGAVFHDITQHVLQSKGIGLYGCRLLGFVLAVFAVHDIAVDIGRIGIEKFTPEGAEALADFNKRVDDVIKSIIENNLHKRLIIVTHGEVIQAAIANAIGIPLNNQFKTYIPSGSATQISYFENWSSLIYSAYIPL